MVAEREVALDKTYFPFKPGFKWTYRSVLNDNSSLTPAQAFEAEVVHGIQTVPVSSLFDPARDNYLNFTVKDDGVYLYALKLGPHGHFVLEQPIVYIPLPATDGLRHDVSGKAIPVIGGQPVNISVSVLLRGPMTIQMPAGKFDNSFLTIIHLSLGNLVSTSRIWWAKGVGAVKGETLTEEGFLKTVELVYAELGDYSVGDPTLACDFEFFEIQTAWQTDKQTSSLSLAEIMRLIAPLNVDAQQIEGFVLKEIAVKGQPKLLFRDNNSNAMVSIALFTSATEAQKVRGEKLKCGNLVAVLAPVDTADKEFSKRVYSLFRKVVALIRYNHSKQAEESDLR